MELNPGLNASLSREQNKLTGSFYTPLSLAEGIVEHSISKWLSRYTGVDFQTPELEQLSSHEKDTLSSALKDVRILDPSVGDGVFLVAAANWTLNARLALGDTDDYREIQEQILSNSLYGVDIQNHAIKQCAISLRRWNSDDFKSSDDFRGFNLKVGNSLIGQIHGSDIKSGIFDSNKQMKPFQWYSSFPEVFDKKGGFDVIIGNPPYGNLLSRKEKEIIVKTTEFDITGGRDGTWNTASLFIARGYHLLNKSGELGFLVPNSILRVRQFLKTRRFLLNPFTLWRIVDEGNPFNDVTLEMISIFCSAQDRTLPTIEVVSRRETIEGSHKLDRTVFTTNKIYSIYYDEIMEKIQNVGTRGTLYATRGRDIPATNLSDNPQGRHTIPFATKGRSVQRYKFDEMYLKYTDNWFIQDPSLIESYENEFLVATKNLSHPRCVMKSKGILHGGGVVRIVPLKDHYDLRVIGLILNSQLSKFVCVRYLTNYSELTTCMNTGIIDEFPLRYPEEPRVYASLFNTLQNAHTQNMGKKQISLLDMVADALVYAAYFSSGNEDQLIDCIIDSSKKSVTRFIKSLSHKDVQSNVEDILSNSLVIRIRTFPRMN